MTEEEAKTKWCPHARCTNSTYTESANREPTSYPTESLNGACNCIASDCMMWCETEPKKYGVPRDGKTSEPTGYCGLVK
jgi:hypothetical protein